jgi:NAD(P)H-dependent flavin oxidoreductase YrpB (nitropropane dioxygenase family)
MKSAICELLKIEFPLVAFSHCRDVVVEVSKAGGMGVLGAVGLSPEELEIELSWIDAQIGGKPYGIDLLVPNVMAGKGERPTRDATVRQVPEEHKLFSAAILNRHGVEGAEVSDAARAAMARFGENMRDDGASRLLDVAFDHPIGLVANALGVPPAYMLERGKQRGVPVAALVGAKEHAIRQVMAGVDILVVAGGEAGGHCGDVSTLVLVPEVSEAIQAYKDVPILAAGGIVTGRQMAACMAMGAAGAWTGSVWLTTAEAETSPSVKEKMLVASSRETVRSKARTGKYSRQLRSAWTDAWEQPDAPVPLPMPLQSIVTEPVLAEVNK